MNDERHPAADAASLDDVGVYALDAHEPDDETGISSHLLASPAAARREQVLRAAAGEYAAARTPENSPPPDLRARVLAAAYQRRAPGTARGDARSGPPTDVASPQEVHRVELQRAVLLLADLTPEDWSRPLDPPEFDGWTVHDLVIHLAANETLLAHELGLPVTGILETATDNAGRTAAARARHRGTSPHRAVRELEAAARAVEHAVAALGASDLDAQVPWWGGSLTLGQALLVRGFETWTHADDVRRALGIPMRVPPPASVRALTRTACGWLPSMLAARGTPQPGRRIRFHFTAPVAASWDVDLTESGHVSPAGDGPVDAEISVDPVDLCRSAGSRLPPGEVVFATTGDAQLARHVIEAVPALAVL